MKSLVKQVSMRSNCGVRSCGLSFNVKVARLGVRKSFSTLASVAVLRAKGKPSVLHHIVEVAFWGGRSAVCIAWVCCSAVLRMNFVERASWIWEIRTCRSSRSNAPLAFMSVR